MHLSNVQQRRSTTGYTTVDGVVTRTLPPRNRQTYRKYLDKEREKRVKLQEQTRARSETKRMQVDTIPRRSSIVEYLNHVLEPLETKIAPYALIVSSFPGAICTYCSFSHDTEVFPEVAPFFEYPPRRALSS